MFLADKESDTTNFLFVIKLFVTSTFPSILRIPLFTTPFELVSPAITPVTTKSLVMLIVASVVFVKPFRFAPFPMDNWPLLSKSLPVTLPITSRMPEVVISSSDVKSPINVTSAE